MCSYIIDRIEFYYPICYLLWVFLAREAIGLALFRAKNGTCHVEHTDKLWQGSTAFASPDPSWEPLCIHKENSGSLRLMGSGQAYCLEELLRYIHTTDAIPLTWTISTVCSQKYTYMLQNGPMLIMPDQSDNYASSDCCVGQDAGQTVFTNSIC